MMSLTLFAEAAVAVAAPAASNAPAWVAVVLAGIAALAQILVAFVQRPREQKAAERAADKRYDDLIKYIDQELGAARVQFVNLKRQTTLPGINDEATNKHIDGAIATLKKEISDLAGIIGDGSDDLADVKRRVDVIEDERRHERKANVDLQLELRELVTTVRFLAKETNR